MSSVSLVSQSCLRKSHTRLKRCLWIKLLDKADGSIFPIWKPILEKGLSARSIFLFVGGQIYKILLKIIDVLFHR